MEQNNFNLDRFNIIEDDNYYYVFRALNNDDYQDIVTGKTAKNGIIERIRTNRERYEENKNKSKYSKSVISLEEVYDHIRMHHLKNTNCISLSSNANVSIDYGKSYHEQYAMIKISKSNFSNFYEAGKYMINEINKKVLEKVNKLSDNSIEKRTIIEIANAKTLENINDTLKKYLNSSNNNKNFNDRFTNKQYFSPNQQLEYNKIIAKMTVLEASGILPSILNTTSNNSSLLSAVGNAFSSSEIIHYGDLNSSDFTIVSPRMMSLIALLQQIKETNNNPKINDLLEKIKNYVIEGYDIKNINGKLYLSNNQNTIDLNLMTEDADIFFDKKINDNDLTIDKIYQITSGKVRYEKAIESISFAYNLSKSKQNATYYTKILKAIINDQDYNDIINEISNMYDVDNSIIDRQNNTGKKISESVNIGMNKNGRKYFSNKEQQEIIKLIDSISIEERNKILSGKIDLNSLIIEKILDKEFEISENEYYIEAIVEGLDFNKIYKYSIEPRTITEEEKFKLCNKLFIGNCKNLYNAFLKAGINKVDIPNYILNLYLEKGYKNYSFEELSNLSDLDEIISKNIKNLNYDIIPIELDKMLDIVDDLNEVENTFISLRDYQKQAVDNIESLYDNGKKFAGVVLPTGAGKSFIAMKIMLNYSNGNIVYFASNREILRQIQRHIVRYIINYGKTDKEKETALSNPDKYEELIREKFPHLKLYCYQGLSTQEEEELERLDANLIILDELHRTGATTWNPKIKTLIHKNKDAKILGLTATPIRDIDGLDMMLEIAKITGDYQPREILFEKYLAINMNLLDAMKDKIVVTPSIVSFDYTLENSDEYNEVKNLYEKETDPEKKEQLRETYQEIRNIISNSKLKGLKGIINENINKKDGRYIVFLPRNNSDLSSEEYIKQQIETVKTYFADIDQEPEIEYLISDRENKKENTQAIKNFENSKSNHLKLIFAIDMLNEGVHVDGIDGLLMLRPISDNSTILYLQQLGRSIFSLDPNHSLDEKDIPIIFDVYNNYLMLNLDRKANKTSTVSDLERLKSVYFWIKKHGYIPDINSINIDEARRAKLLKRIKMKYEKYLEQSISNNLTEKEIYEINEILKLGKEINLWNIDIPNRVIKPDEKEIDRIETFELQGTMKKFSDLVKKSRRIVGVKKQSENTRLKICLLVLDILNEYGYEINNTTIKQEYIMNDIISMLPSYANELLDELGISNTYPIGLEYNELKRKLYRSRKNPFEEYDLEILIKLGLYESFIENDKVTSFVDEFDFIVKGPTIYRGLNIHTRTIYDKNGYNIDGIDEHKFNREHIHSITKKSNDMHDFNYLGINFKTGTILDIHNFDIDGYFYELIDGKYHNTGKKYNNYGFDIDGCWHDLTRQSSNSYLSFDKKGFNIDGLNQFYFDREGYYWGLIDEEIDWKREHKDLIDLWGEERTYDYLIRTGKRIKTNKKLNPDGFNKDGLAPRKKKTGEIVLFPLNKYNFDIHGYWYELKNGKYIKKGKIDQNGFNFKGIHTETKKLYDKKGFDRDGYYWEQVDEENRIKTTNKTDKNGFNKDGLTIVINEKGEKEYRQLNKYGFDRDGLYHGEKYNQYRKYELYRIDKYGFDINGINESTETHLSESNFDRDGYYWENGANTTKKYNHENFDRDGYYWELSPSGERIKTNSKRNPEGYNAKGLNEVGFNRNGEYLGKTGIYHDNYGFDFYGIHKDTKKPYDNNMFTRVGIKYINLITNTDYDIRGFNIDGEIDKESIAYVLGKLDFYSSYLQVSASSNTKTYSDPKGFNANGINDVTNEKVDINGYNAFGVDINGKMSNGETHPDIIFLKKYISLLIDNKLPQEDDFIKNYLNQKYKELKKKISKDRILTITIYASSIMYPKILQELNETIENLRKDLENSQKELKQKKSKLKDIQKLLSGIEDLQSIIKHNIR